MNLTQSQKGTLSIISSCFLWSFFPIITILTFSDLPPVFSASLSTLMAGVFFGVMLTAQKKWQEVKIFSAYKDIFLATMFIGMFYYALLFTGLQKTTAGNASIVMLMEIFFAMVILSLWKKEFLTKNHIIGAVLMALGAFMILFQGNFSVNSGNLIILIAVTLPPIGNYFMQNARKKVSSTFIMFFRSLLSSFFLLILSSVLEDSPNQEAIVNSIPFLLINGLLLMGFSKILWIEGLHRISITKATSFIAINPALTLIFAYLILTEVPTYWQILGFIPIIIGVTFITDFKLKRIKKM